MRTLVVVGYDELPDAAQHCEEITEQWRPIGLKALDHLLIEDQLEKGEHVSAIEELPRRDRPDPAWLLGQFGADAAEESKRTAARFRDWLTGKKGYASERLKILPSAQEGGHSGDLWEIREGGLGATAFPPDGRDHWPGWEDSAVPPNSSATTCAICAGCRTNTTTQGRCTATSARAASTPGSRSTRAPPRGLPSSASSWRRPGGRS